MKYCLLFIFSLFLPATLFAQKPDTVTKTLTSGPELWVDYGKILLYPTSVESKLEAGFTWRIRRVAPVIHYGYAELFPEQAIKNGSYEASGWYIRGGVDYYIPLDRANRFILGGRYSYASYSEIGSYRIESTLWPPETGGFDRDALTATWAELIIGSEMTLRNSRFVLGGYFSLRVLIDREEFQPVDTYAIPGYGRTIDQTVPGLQLFIKFSLAR